MPNDIIRNMYISRVCKALSNARDISKVEHAGIKGRAREIFVKNIIEPVLPPYVDLGSGKIVDSTGQQSPEMDVVIFSRHTLPPLMFEEGFGLYPAEACIYAIEVKSRLNKKELRTTIEKFAQLKSMKYLPPAMSKTYQPIGSAPPVIPLLFAFDTDLSIQGKDELERYRELDQTADIDPVVPIICVAGRGYWWFKPNEPAEKWMKFLATDQHEEVVDMIGGIANTIPDQILAKGRPRFGQYLIRPRNFEKH